MIIRIILTSIGGYLGWFIGGIDVFIYTLITFVVIDYVSGVMVAIADKKLSSEIGYRGIFKKVLIFALVGVGNILDFYVIKNGNALRTAIVFFYLSNEGISILENAAIIGLPIPKKLKEALKLFNIEDK